MPHKRFYADTIEEAAYLFIMEYKSTFINLRDICRHGKINYDRFRIYMLRKNVKAIPEFASNVPRVLKKLYKFDTKDQFPVTLSKPRRPVIIKLSGVTVSKALLPVIIDTSKHPLYKEGDPPENTVRFMMKYYCNNYEQLSDIVRRDAAIIKSVTSGSVPLSSE